MNWKRRLMMSRRNGQMSLKFLVMIGLKFKLLCGHSFKRLTWFNLY